MPPSSFFVKLAFTKSVYSRSLTKRVNEFLKNNKVPLTVTAVGMAGISAYLNSKSKQRRESNNIFVNQKRSILDPYKFN